MKSQNTFVHMNTGTHVPIIALTAYVDDENKKCCIEVGMNAVLAKPFVKEKAEDILNAFIPHRKKLQEIEFTLKAKEESKLPYVKKTINIKAMKQILGDNEEILHQTLEIFQGSLVEEVKKLQFAYNEGDWPAIQAIVHKIKGGCVYCGVARLKKACSRLETSIKSKKTKLFVDFYTQLLKEIKTVKEAIETKNY